MTLKQQLQQLLETEELRTASDSFGGNKSAGKTLRFNIARITEALLNLLPGYPSENVTLTCKNLSTKCDQRQLIYLISSAVRFSFLIELTNLTISSTRIKTRWYPGKILRTAQTTYQNYQASFSPGHDQRSSSFDACFAIFEKVLADLVASPIHLEIAKSLSIEAHRSIAYEFVFSYIEPKADPVHLVSNIRLVDISHIGWLIRNRKVIHSVLTKKNVDKIITKTFLTDRSLTGADQTNRAKRWEVLSADFQHATIEECWSVERKLLSQLLTFENFPAVPVSAEIPPMKQREGHRCPITLKKFDFNEFKTESEHGRSVFQVGHMTPLKTGGRHVADNVAWVTQDGNRIQGDLTLDQTQKLLDEIYARRAQLSNINKLILIG